MKVAAVCVFDLDHTLVSSPLDLQLVAREMEGFARRSGFRLPERELPWYGAEILELVRANLPQLENDLMAIPVTFERKAMQEAVLEPFAKEMLQQLRMLGYATARCGQTTIPWPLNSCWADSKSSRYSILSLSVIR
jgi:hypothetical protein